MNVAVMVAGALTSETVAWLPNHTHLQTTGRQTRPHPVKAYLCWRRSRISYNSSFKWKISLHPIVVSCADLGNMETVAYPVINGSEDDKFIEMVIGKDIQSQWPNIFDVSMADYRFDSSLAASPRPGYMEGVYFMGHNIELVSANDVPKDEWYEYLAWPSTRPITSWL